MSVHKDKERKTWYVCVRYTDWQGNRRMKKKRGFSLEREAKEWEREFLRTSKRSCDMTFASFVDLYMDDMGKHLKPYTMKTKHRQIYGRIVPCFGKMKLNEITPVHVRKWHGQLVSEGLAATYQRDLHAQLSAIFNYAVRYYNLEKNPAKIAGSIGSGKPEDTMHFWSPEEFSRFIACVYRKSVQATFMTLFWTGLRIGELLALCPEDIDLESGVIRVRKSLQTLEKKDVVTSPKTKKSRRDVPIPEKLREVLREYISSIYDLQPDQRIFTHSKDILYAEMRKGSAAAGLEKIRIHDLRHSYASMLINNGVQALQVSELLGHENIETTLNTYSHLYQKTRDAAMGVLNTLMK